MLDKSLKLILLSNNAVFCRKEFYKKLKKYFKDEFDADTYKQIEQLFTIDMCYNAAYVLAQELDQQI